MPKLDVTPHRRPRLHRTALWFACVLASGSCGFNEVVVADEDVKASWSEVQNQYKRRADLVPQLVSTVKGAAKFEQDTLTQVVEARSKVGSMRIDGDSIADPAKLKAFEAAQAQMTGALSRLMVVMERYPDLKASAQFRELQAQLEGSENRITVARQRFIAEVGNYNKLVQVYPTMIGAFVRGRHVRPTFEGAAGSEVAPEIKF